MFSIDSRNGVGDSGGTVRAWRCLPSLAPFFTWCYICRDYQRNPNETGIILVAMFPVSA